MASGVLGSGLMTLGGHAAFTCSLQNRDNDHLRSAEAGNHTGLLFFCPLSHMLKNDPPLKLWADAPS